MATASPTGNLMAQQLMQRLAAMAAARNGGAPGAGASAGPGAGSPDPSADPNAGGNSPDVAGSQLSQQLSGVAGADPEMMVKNLTNIKGMLVALFNRSAFQLPAVSRQLAQAMKYIDNAIKDSQQAAQTVQTVNAQITNNAAMSSPSAGSGGGM